MSIANAHDKRAEMAAARAAHAAGSELNRIFQSWEAQRVFCADYKVRVWYSILRFGHIRVVQMFIWLALDAVGCSALFLSTQD